MDVVENVRLGELHPPIATAVSWGVRLLFVLGFLFVVYIPRGHRDHYRDL
jgi:hypothetical protein